MSREKQSQPCMFLFKLPCLIWPEIHNMSHNLTPDSFSNLGQLHCKKYPPYQASNSGPLPPCSIYRWLTFIRVRIMHSGRFSVCLDCTSLHLITCSAATETHNECMCLHQEIKRRKFILLPRFPWDNCDVIGCLIKGSMEQLLICSWGMYPVKVGL